MEKTYNSYATCPKCKCVVLCAVNAVTASDKGIKYRYQCLEKHNFSVTYQPSKDLFKFQSDMRN